MEQKRLILFVACFALATFLVNLFFYHQDQERLQKWKQQQASKNVLKVQQLEKDLLEKTAKTADLPLVNLYRDQKGEQFLTTGIQDNRTILTLAWNGEPPQTLYARGLNSTAAPEEFVLDFAPTTAGEPIIYRKGLPGKVTIGDLPDFGRFELQLVTLNPLEVTPIDYVDGHMANLKKNLEKLKDPLLQATPPKAGIVLMKSRTGFVPVALFDGRSGTPVYLEEIPALQSLIVKVETPVEKKGETPLSKQKFYVLENGYLQLVFSNVGGALAEINLPYESKEDEKSVVKPIEADREMVEKHPWNAHFPSHPYHTPGTNPAGPFKEHIEGRLGGYYPLIRRDLIINHAHQSVPVPPRLYALNLVSEYPEVAETTYEVKEFTPNKIVFESVQPHRTVRKTFTIDSEMKGAPYGFNLDIKVEGDARGLWLTSGVPEVEMVSGAPAPAVKYRITRHGKGEVETVDLPKDAFTNTSVFPDWVVNSNGFLGLILNPTLPIDPGFRVQLVPGTVASSRLVELEKEYQKYKPQDFPGYNTMVPLKHDGGNMSFHIFAGPFADSVLKAADQFYADPATGYKPDFIASQSFHGWFAFISEPFAKFLFILMNFFYQLTHSWAFSIILLTVVLRLMLYPLNAWSMKSMIRMQKIAPEVTAIQEKYKKDPKRAQLEIMNLYREKKVNPLSGCLPILIQIPFLIGMFDLLKSTVELRGASFIPGWIDNLTAPDVLFSWTTPIFFIGNQFHLLPILLGALMFVQQRMMSTLPKDPSLWTDQQRQQRAMTTIMPLVFTVMFYHFPSGLNIYWLSSTVLGIIQQWWTQKQMAKVAVK